MENQDKVKDNILKGVNKKLKIRSIKIAITSIIVCTLIGIVGYLLLRTPIIRIDIMNADSFKNVSIETRMQTITEVDDKELLYNHFFIDLTDSMISAMNEKTHFYVKNNSDNTAILYFYISENYIKEDDNSRIFKYNVDMLLHPHNPNILKTDNFISEITKVYYLVYDYDNFNQQDFDKVKDEAVLLWEK